MTRLTPSRASDTAQPLPSPFEAAQTSAVLPRIPRSMVSSSSFRLPRYEHHARDHEQAADRLHPGEGLSQPERARQRDAYRADGADEGEVVGADAVERFGLQEPRQHRAERREPDDVDPYRAR